MISPLVIRADANLSIGFGHVMRCLALAQAWREHGGEALLVAADTLPLVLQKRLNDLPLDFELLDVTQTSDHEQTIALAQRLHAQWIVVDGYHFDKAYLSALKAAGFRVLGIDDLGHLSCDNIDLVLNQNIYAAAALYPGCPPTTLLLGTRFAILRQEFYRSKPIERPPSDYAHNLLITLGGTDANNITRLVLEALALVTSHTFEVVVVVGGGNPHFDSLQAAAAVLPHHVRFEKNTDDMVSLMTWADMGVTAAGSTLWEIAYVGLPCVALVIADNQIPNAERMEQLGALVLADLNVEDLSMQIMSLAESSFQRSTNQSLLRAMVDGNGAARTVTTMLELEHDDPYRLRFAEWEDRYTLWEWANDPVTRQNSFNPQPITWADHISWFTGKIQSADTRIWILEYLMVPVGQIRYDRMSMNAAQISYTVAPAWRGRGLGTQLLKSTSQMAMNLLEIDTVEGETFAHNTASIRAFEKAQFSRVGQKILSDQPVYVFRERRSLLS